MSHGDGDGRPRPGRVAIFIAWPLAGLTAVSAACILIAPWVWWADLCTHWSAHLAVVALVPLVLLRHQRRQAWLLTAGFLILVAPGIRAAWSSRLPVLAEGEGFSVVSANRHRDNPVPPTEAFAALDADLLILHEVDADDVFGMQALGRWPFAAWHFQEQGRWKGLGSALFSRIPIIDSTDWRGTDGPGVDVVLLTRQGRLRLVVVHAQSPMSAAQAALRHRQFAIYADIARTSPDPVAFIGDFNCTPRSPAWWALERDGLQRSAGWASATWPAWSGVMGIPIDQVLGRGIALAPIATFAQAGSDHRGISFRVSASGNQAGR